MSKRSVGNFVYKVEYYPTLRAQHKSLVKCPNFIVLHYIYLTGAMNDLWISNQSCPQCSLLSMCSNLKLEGSRDLCTCRDTLRCPLGEECLLLSGCSEYQKSTLNDEKALQEKRGTTAKKRTLEWTGHGFLEKSPEPVNKEDVQILRKSERSLKKAKMNSPLPTNILDNGSGITKHFGDTKSCLSLQDYNKWKSSFYGAKQELARLDGVLTGMDMMQSMRCQATKADKSGLTDTLASQLCCLTTFMAGSNCTSCSNCVIDTRSSCPSKEASQSAKLPPLSLRQTKSRLNGTTGTSSQQEFSKRLFEE